MTIHNVSAYDIKRILASINRDYGTSLCAEKVVEYKTESKHVRVRCILRLHDSADTFHRRGPTTARRMRNVCWHGQMLFWLRLFQFNPSAKVKTTWMWYSDLDDFLQKAPRACESLQHMCDCALEGEIDNKVNFEIAQAIVQRSGRVIDQSRESNEQS